MRFCRPLVSLGDDPETVYVTEEPNWDEPGTLVRTDIADAKMLATVLPEHAQRDISPQFGVVVAGRGFVEAAQRAGIKDKELSSLCPDEIDSGYRMGLTTPNDYRQFKTRLVEKARNVFDEELESAVRELTPLSERGRAAIFLLRKSAPRNEELAVRQLASAFQDGPPNAYPRLLTGFALELDMPKVDVQRRVSQYMTQPREGFRTSIVEMLVNWRDSGTTVRSPDKVGTDIGDWDPQEQNPSKRVRAWEQTIQYATHETKNEQTKSLEAA